MRVLLIINKTVDNDTIYEVHFDGKTYNATRDTTSDSGAIFFMVQDNQLKNDITNVFGNNIGIYVYMDGIMIKGIVGYISSEGTIQVLVLELGIVIEISE